MTTAFDRALAHTVGIEGGYSDHPADSGGKTRFGITERVARAYGYEGDMSALPIELAIEMYRQNYWGLLKLNRIADVSEPVALELFDTCVNTKHGFAARSLQRCLNVLNHGGTYYNDLEVDGLIGQVTIHALGAFLKRRGKEGERVLVEMLNGLQGAFYIELAEAREKDEAFVYGWILQRVMKRAA